MPFPHQFSRLIDNPLRRFIIAPGKLVLRLSLRGDERILELGPGSGYFSGHLAEAVPKGELHLVDLQPQMLEKAKRKLQASGMDNVAYTTLDAGGSFPFADHHFDVCSYGQRTWGSCEPAILSEFARTSASSQRSARDTRINPRSRHDRLRTARLSRRA